MIFTIILDNSERILQKILTMLQNLFENSFSYSDLILDTSRFHDLIKISKATRSGSRLTVNV